MQKNGELRYVGRTPDTYARRDNGAVQVATNDPILDNSKRVRAFRASLIKQIPRIPNNKSSLRILESKAHTDLLIIYMCWRLRHVAIRPRTVIDLSVLDCDSRATALTPNIEAFTRDVEMGSDLTPYLSLKANRDGYVVAYDPGLTNTSSWEDKDFLLNVMGLHHFHLGLKKEKRGHVARTNEVLFAYVSRDSFQVLGLFDHSVFDWTVEDELTPERARLWSVFNEFQATQAATGEIMIGGIGGMGITTAGTPTVVTWKAIKQVEIIRKLEPNLDDIDFVKSLYGEHQFPEKIKLSWHYNHLDFGLVNEPSREFLKLLPGPVP